MKTLNFALTSGTMVLVHTSAAPDPREWSAYTAAVLAARRGRGITGVLVVTEGGAPDAAQRSQLAKAFGDDPVLTAVCNSSAIVRRVITAVGWLSRALVRGFEYDDLPRAMAFLEVKPAQVAEITALVARLQREIAARPVRV